MSKSMKFQFNSKFRFILSYLIVTMLPLSLVLLYFYPNTREAVVQGLMDSNLHVTEQAMSSMDIQFDNIYKIPVELFGNKILKKSQLEQDEFNRYLALDEMSKYISTNKFVHSAFLYIRETKKLYSSTTVFSIDDFGVNGTAYRYAAWPFESFKHTLDTLTLPLVRPSEPIRMPDSHEGRMITFLYPLPIGNSRPYGTVMILVDEAVVRNLVRKTSPQYGGNLVMLDSEGRSMLAWNQEAYMSSPDYAALLGHLDQKGSRVSRLEGQNYLVSWCRSTRNGWTYLSLVPEAQALAPINRITWTTLGLILTLLLLESLVIFWALRTNYRPLRALADFARQRTSVEKNGKLDEFGAIRFALDSLTSTNDALGKKILSTDAAMREYCLYALLNGQYASLEEFNEEARQYGVHFSSSLFEIAVLRLLDEAVSSEHPSSPETVDNWLTRLSALPLPDQLQGYFISGLQRGQAILITSTDHPGLLEQHAETIMAHIGHEPGFLTAIGLGGRAAGTTKITHSWQCAQTAVEALYLRQCAAVRQSGGSESSQYIVRSYPTDAMEQFEMGLLRKEPALIRTAAAQLQSVMKREDAPVFLIRGIYYNVMNSLAGTMSHLSKPENKSLWNIPLDAVNQYSLEQILNLVDERITQVCAVMEAHVGVGAKGLSLDEILRYIAERYTEYDFSLATVAAHFNMSFSNFSHYFKNTSGLNFRDHVDGLRIGRAKYQLDQTGNSLDDIAREIGYANASSFTRAFKKTTGLTPGEYRSAARAATPSHITDTRMEHLQKK